MSINQTKA